MVGFRSRRLERTKTLGERLRKVREEAGYTLEEAEAGTQIRRKYLEQIEQGQYSQLPGPVYIENFLKAYAKFLDVSEDFVLSVYRHQEQKVVKKDFEPKFADSSSDAHKSLINPKRVRLGIILLIVLGCLVYVGVEVGKIFSPPTLTVTSPNDSITVSSESLIVTGKTTPEVVLTINGQQVFLNQQGEFSENLALKEGLNVITISAIKKHSKATVVERRVLYEKLSP